MYARGLPHFSLNCHGSDCNIDYSLCLCCFSRAPCECLSLRVCLCLVRSVLLLDLRSLVEQFAPHYTHVDDSDLNLSECIRMLVLVLTLRYCPGGGERFALHSFFPLCVSLCVCLNSLYYDGGCGSESNLYLTHTHAHYICEERSTSLFRARAKELYFALLPLCLICVS
jgi:hypothetical protein